MAHLRERTDESQSFEGSSVIGQRNNTRGMPNKQHNKGTEGRPIGKVKDNSTRSVKTKAEAGVGRQGSERQPGDSGLSRSKQRQRQATLGKRMGVNTETAVCLGQRLRESGREQNKCLDHAGKKVN